MGSPETASWERDQQGLGQGQMDRSVLHQEGDRLSQQQWVGKSFRPKRETDMDLHGCKLEREHTWIYTNMSRAAPEKRKQGSRRGKGGKGWTGQQNKNPRFENYTVHFRKKCKSSF